MGNNELESLMKQVAQLVKNGKEAERLRIENNQLKQEKYELSKEIADQNSLIDYYRKQNKKLISELENCKSRQ